MKKRSKGKSCSRPREVAKESVPSLAIRGLDRVSRLVVVKRCVVGRRAEGGGGGKAARVGSGGGQWGGGATRRAAGRGEPRRGVAHSREAPASLRHTCAFG